MWLSHTFHHELMAIIIYSDTKQPLIRTDKCDMYYCVLICLLFSCFMQCVAVKMYCLSINGM